MPTDQVANPSLFAAARLGFRPDSQQTAVLDSQYQRVILCCSRQWGKSTTTAAMAVHQAFFTNDSLILIAGPTERQSAELLRKCKRFLAKLGIRARSDGHNKASVLLPNGSRVVALPNAVDNILGFSAPSLIVIDEAARVPDELYHALLPMLAAVPHGRIWLLSTPHGKQGFFYHEWSRHDSDYCKISVTANECPRIPKDFLDAEARRLPKHVFEEFYLCLFHSSSTSLFPEELLQSAFDTTIPPL